jgi:hypothetical protein
MSKFEEVPESIVKIMDDEIKNSFPTIVNARIKMLYNMSKKTSGGMLIMGQMVKATPILNYLTSSDDGADDGYNYIMFLDGNVFPSLDTADQKRVIRHELNHIFIDLDATNPYKVVGHEVEDFFKEIEYNKDEPKWKDRVFAIAEQVYEQIEEAKAAAKKK